MALVDELITKGVLKSKRLIEAFYAVDRKNFLPENLKESAYLDEPLPIGEGQTISQPWTVAFMLELLSPAPGENIMEIGYGSGWKKALLAATGANVYAIELVPELCKFGKENFKKFGRGKVRFYCQDGTLGLPEIAERIGGFDKIIVAAALGAAKIPTHVGTADLLPPAWKDQLKAGGRIVTPIGHSIFEFIKKPASPSQGGPDEAFEEIEHPGFAFVPLVSK